jgi:energy-coupling factor transport system ATP-binding protein
MIRVEHLSFKYEKDQQLLLNDINLEIKDNDFIVITGKSGCGKTTLALAICGYLFEQNKECITGIININGRDIREMDFGSISNEIYLVQQNPENQFCTLTIQDEIAFGLENQGMEPKIINERVDWALQSVNASEIRHRDLRTLSGGEQQKVAIASAVAMQPRIIILDEPTSFLDIKSTKHILDILMQLKKKEKLTLIVIEHKLSHLVPFNPKIILLDKGRILPLPIGQNEEHIQRKNIFREKNNNKSKDPVIEIKDLILCKGNKEILDIKNLKVYPGEFISLLGDNGSGKTSLLYTMLGINKNNCGTIKIFGKTVRSFRSSNKNGKIGIVFQNPNHQFFTDSVYDEIIFPIKNYFKQERKYSNWVAELIHKFELDDFIDFHPLKLSYGQKKKLSIASVLSYQPELLLLDEIFIGQSVEEIIFIMQLLDDYKNEFSATIILVNHQPDIVGIFADRTIILEDGKISSDTNNYVESKNVLINNKSRNNDIGRENDD